MIVTPDYYWGWLGGFLCGVGVTAITFLISKTRNNVEMSMILMMTLRRFPIVKITAKTIVKLIA